MTLRPELERRPFGPSLYDLGALVEAVAAVTHHANPVAPESVSTRAFDRARPAAGHPSCPTAKAISYERLHMSWPEVKQLALDPERCVDRTFGRRFADGDWSGISAVELRLALRGVAKRLGVTTVSGAEYMRERARMLEVDWRCYRHGRQLRLPTEEQILVAAGSWPHALVLAGLGPLTHDRSHTAAMTAVEVLDLFVIEYGYVATLHELRGFARQRGYSLERWGRAYEVDIAEVGALRAMRGEVMPERRPPKCERPRFDGPRMVPGNRRKKRWTDEELVAALVTAFELLPPRVRMTVESYRRHCAQRPGFPPASAFTRRGRRGFVSYRESARAARLAVEATVTGRAA